ncbi:MAG TPA: hypothetical protein DEO60_12545 [Bacteroidales bacterium]|nr:hypothetical protein [Bacteroidales bacterium]HBZ21952.1 hypothetical protein [Bacteroidales bacterium]
MITGPEIQDTIRPKLVIRINTEKLLPDSVFRKIDEAPAHIRYADSVSRLKRISKLPEVSISDTTSVCSRNSIADFTLYDSLSFVRNIRQLPPRLFPYHLADKILPETHERRITVINELRDGKELPWKPFNHDWIIAIVFLTAYVWLIVRTTTRSIFPELTKFILFRGINESSAHDTGSLFTWQSTVLNFISFLVISLFVYCAADFYGVIPAGFPPIIFMLISLVLVVLAITSRHFICLAAGNLSGESDLFKEYLINVYQSYRFSAVIVFIVVILLVYTVFLPSGVLIISGIIVFTIFYLMRVFRLFLIFIKRNISVLYLILYLCALEILPVLIIVKYFTGLDLE